MKAEYWTLINTFVSALIGAVVAVVIFWIQILREEKKEKKKEYDTYKKYSKPIMFSAETLAWRLKEILSFNSNYLLPDAPENGFFKYKFDSTVYRLCAFIGWIRATQREQSYIEGYGSSKSRKVQETINSFQKALADGEHIEVSIYEELCKLYCIPNKEITAHKRKEIGVEIEVIIFKFIQDDIFKNVINLPRDTQRKMMNDILETICNKTNQEIPSSVATENKIELAIMEITREFCWIYRDWQNAIGDEMIIQANNNYRNFDIIGLREFELIQK